MMLLSILSEETLRRYARETTKIAELNAFHEKVNTLPLSEEKEIISLFRSAMGMDSWVEEFLSLQEQIETTVQPTNINPVLEETKDNMEINEEKNLRELYIDSVENSWMNLKERQLN